MTLLADLISTILERGARTKILSKKGKGCLPDLIMSLLGATGEVSGLTIAGSILDHYESLDDEGRLQFFRYLARSMSIDPVLIRAALEELESEVTPASYGAFMAVAEPPRQELIRRLNQLPGATPRLVQMRSDLLRLGREDASLRAIDLDFKHLFTSWFNRGFLVQRPVNWRSSALILEKIIAYEAVHAIESWNDLRRRLLPPDRRCFSFFHPAMPDEPLIFVEVALTKGIPNSVQAILAENRDEMEAENADTAVFYSISNCQAGLAGISFGNSLIKQVAYDLAAELPNLRTFVTLSPIPGLTDWLEQQGLPYDSTDSEGMRRLASRYILTAKRADGLPRDPVARFHLGNGALVHAILAGADISEKGLQQSGGVMVNYLYDLKKVSENHERFASRQEVIASQAVRTLFAEA